VFKGRRRHSSDLVLRRREAASNLVLSLSKDDSRKRQKGRVVSERRRAM